MPHNWRGRRDLFNGGFITMTFSEWVEREYGNKKPGNWILGKMEAAWKAGQQDDNAPPFHISISDSYTEYKFQLDLPDSYSIAKIYEEICKGFGIAERQGIIRRR